ncbi:MAG: hypothetical protein JNM56_15545 [Planctomycetia bacterium]|nr:hypothetical protein [Planctomycetia bacterium]
MMKPTEFEQAVNAFRHRQPFRPFVIELDGGERIIVRDPQELSCCYGGADYEGPTDDDFAFIECYEVRQVVELAEAQPAS